MSKQPSTSRWPVALAAMFLALTVAGFAAAFYVFDGESYTDPLWQQIVALVAPQELTQPSTTPTETASTLTLPAGMPEEFALRLWQEQLDSQPMIERLVDGEVRSLKINKVEKSAEEARLSVTVVMADGTSAPGTIGMRRFGENWYVSHATRTGTGSDRAIESRPLPALADVDTALLGAMIAEQTKSQPVIRDYLAGIVKEVFIEEVTPGARAVSMKVEMDETHGDGYARLVAIQSEDDGAPAWFLARFTKTGDETQTAQ